MLGAVLTSQITPPIIATKISRATIPTKIQIKAIDRPVRAADGAATVGVVGVKVGNAGGGVGVGAGGAGWGFVGAPGSKGPGSLGLPGIEVAPGGLFQPPMPF